MSVRDARLLKQLVNKAKEEAKGINFGILVENFPGKSKRFLKKYYYSMNTCQK
jgi:hypothetical protein